MFFAFALAAAMAAKPQPPALPVAPAPAPAAVVPGVPVPLPAAPVPAQGGFLVIEAPPPDDWPPGRLWADVMAAPFEADLYRFPPREACAAARAFNYSFRCKMDKEREIWPDAPVQAIFDEANSAALRSYAIWDKLDDCHHGIDWQPWWKRRLMLAELRTLMGPENYAAAKMPPAVPVHLFRELK